MGRCKGRIGIARNRKLYKKRARPGETRMVVVVVVVRRKDVGVGRCRCGSGMDKGTGELRGKERREV